MLSLVGAALGVFVAWFGVGLLRSAMPLDVPRVGTIAVNLRVLGTTAIVAVVTGLVFGLAPGLAVRPPGRGRRAQSA